MSKRLATLFELIFRRPFVIRLYLLGKMMNEQDQVEIFESLLQQTVDRLFDKYDGNFDRLDKQEQELVYIWRAEADIYNGGMLMP